MREIAKLLSPGDYKEHLQAMKENIETLKKEKPYINKYEVIALLLGNDQDDVTSYTARQIFEMFELAKN